MASHPPTAPPAVVIDDAPTAEDIAKATAPSQAELEAKTRKLDAAKLQLSELSRSSSFPTNPTNDGSITWEGRLFIYNVAPVKQPTVQFVIFRGTVNGPSSCVGAYW